MLFRSCSCPLGHSHGRLLRQVSGHEQVQAEGRRGQADGQTAHQDDAEVDGVHAQGLHSGQQDGGQDDDGGAGIHDHAQDQEQDDQDRQDAPGSGEVAHDEVLDHLGGAGQGQHAAESGGESQHESQAAVSLDRAGQEGDQVLQRDGAVHHQGDEQSVEHGHAGRLSGGDDAGVDAAQHDDGAQQGEEAVSKQLQEAVAPQLGHLGADALLVLALGDAEDHRIGHHEQANQDAGDDAGQEQVAGGNAGGQGVEHEGDGGRNDDADNASAASDGGCPGLIVLLLLCPFYSLLT